MQSIEQVGSSPPAEVPTRASSQSPMAMSLGAVSNDHTPVNRNQTITPADNQIQGAFRELFSIMHRSQNDSSPTLRGTSADTHGAGLLPIADADIDDAESHRGAAQDTQGTGSTRSAGLIHVINSASDGEHDTPSPSPDQVASPAQEN